MSRLSVNELEMSINVCDQLTYDDYLDRIVNDLKDATKEWVSQITPSDVNEKDIAEQCTAFIEDVENGLNTQHKLGLLNEVVDEFYRQKNFPVFEPDLFDVEFLEDAVIAYVIKEWGIDEKLLKSYKNFG